MDSKMIEKEFKHWYDTCKMEMSIERNMQNAFKACAKLMSDRVKELEGMYKALNDEVTRSHTRCIELEAVINQRDNEIKTIRAISNGMLKENEKLKKELDEATEIIKESQTLLEIDYCNTNRCIDKSGEVLGCDNCGIGKILITIEQFLEATALNTSQVESKSCDSCKGCLNTTRWALNKFKKDCDEWTPKVDVKTSNNSHNIEKELNVGKSCVNCGQIKDERCRGRWTNVCENWTPKADKVEGEK